VLISLLGAGYNTLTRPFITLLSRLKVLDRLPRSAGVREATRYRPPLRRVDHPSPPTASPLEPKIMTGEKVEDNRADITSFTLHIMITVLHYHSATNLSSKKDPRGFRFVLKSCVDNIGNALGWSNVGVRVIRVMLDKYLSFVRQKFSEFRGDINHPSWHNIFQTHKVLKQMLFYKPINDKVVLLVNQDLVDNFVDLLKGLRFDKQQPRSFSNITDQEKVREIRRRGIKYLQFWSQVQSLLREVVDKVTDTKILMQLANSLSLYGSAIEEGGGSDKGYGAEDEWEEMDYSQQDAEGPSPRGEKREIKGVSGGITTTDSEKESDNEENKNKTHSGDTLTVSPLQQDSNVIQERTTSIASQLSRDGGGRLKKSPQKGRQDITTIFHAVQKARESTVDTLL